MTLTPLLDSKKKWLIAYHEVGHALLMTLLKHADPLNKVTIIPRSGGVGGFAQQIFDEERVDSGLYTRAWLLDEITILLGGALPKWKSLAMLKSPWVPVATCEQWPIWRGKW